MKISIFPCLKNPVRSRRRRGFILFFPVLFFSLYFFPGSITLAYSEETQTSSELQRNDSSLSVPESNSLEAHKEWLRKNTEHNNYYTVLEKTITLFTNIDNVISFLKEQIQYLKTNSQRFQILHILGQYEKLSGDFESAQRHYQLASSFDKGVLGLKALFSSAYLLFQMGELDRCENQIKKILSNEEQLDNNTIKQTWLLYSNVLASKNKTVKAKQICDMVYKKYEDSLSSQEVYILYSVSKNVGLNEIEKKTSDIIRKKYPQSPEYSLVYGGPVEELVWPRFYLTPEKATTKETQVQTESYNGEKEDQNNEFVMIQIGSFTVIDNAKTMVSTLEKKGFSAVIKEKTVRQTIYYTVVLPKIPKGKSQEFLIKLKDKGIEGFLIY